jgi:ABC-type Fe2+-enterobactin transport system substrate-binding protein
MPRPQAARSIQYVTSVWPSTTKLATLPASCPSQVTARMVMSGVFLTMTMCASNAPLSPGSATVNAAIQTDSGSRI